MTAIQYFGGGGDDLKDPLVLRFSVLDGESITLPSISSGIYNYIVDWGDGTRKGVNSYNSVDRIHQYTIGGSKDVKIYGKFSTLNFSTVTTSRTKLTEIVEWGEVGLTTLFFAFMGCSNLTTVSSGEGTRSVISFESCFRDCASLNNIGLFNSSSSASFRSMYMNCTSTTSFPLHNTILGTSFEGMYSGCTSATDLPLINTINGVIFGRTTTNGMYENCSSATSFPPINTSSGQYFSRMYRFNTSAITFPVINTVNGLDFQEMYRNCTSATSFPPLNTSKANFITGSGRGMYQNCPACLEFPYMDTSSINTFIDLYRYCTLATIIPPLDSSSVTDFSNCFGSCVNIEEAALQGTRYSISYGGNKLDRDAIIDIFNGLGIADGAQTITLIGNPGVVDLTPTDLLIATNKGWTVST